jgi:hypothetical protein
MIDTRASIGISRHAKEKGGVYYAGRKNENRFI